MTSPDEIAIEFRHAGYRLGDDSSAAGRAESRLLISDLNLKIRRGETLMLLGRSGSGKTTSLKLINRLLAPTSGVVLVDGRDGGEWELLALRRRIGYAIQGVGLFPHYTVEQNVGLVPSIEHWRAPRIVGRVAEVLRLVGLPPEEFASRYPFQLSGGQQQRVGLARALAADPPILLMDEPFGALDPITRTEIQRQFRELQQRLRKTVVFVTHDLGEAMLLGDRIALLEAGELQGVYTPAEFLTSPDAHVRSYVEALQTAWQATSNAWEEIRLRAS